MTKTITYGYLEGQPTISIKGDSESAWIYANGKWTLDTNLDVFRKAAVLSKVKFEEMFGQLPLPPNT